MEDEQFFKARLLPFVPIENESIRSKLRLGFNQTAFRLSLDQKQGLKQFELTSNLFTWEL